MQGIFQKRFKPTNLALVLLLIIAGCLGGCATTPWNTNTPPPGTITPLNSNQGTSLSSPNRPVVSDFPDVMLPNELAFEPQNSYVFQGPKTKAGLLVYKGRVEPRSVIEFFQAAMPRESWQFKGGIRSQKSVLVFEKPEKICIISVYESMYYTYVEVCMTPISSQI